MTERPLLVSGKIDLHLTLHDARVVALHVGFQRPVGLGGGARVVTEIPVVLVMRVGSQFPTPTGFLLDESEMLGHDDVESKDGPGTDAVAGLQDDFLSRHVQRQVRRFVIVEGIHGTAVAARHQCRGGGHSSSTGRLDAFPVDRERRQTPLRSLWRALDLECGRGPRTERWDSTFAYPQYTVRRSRRAAIEP